MSLRLTYGTVRESQRRAIYVVRVHDELLDPPEIDDLSARMRDRLAWRGEPIAEVVIVHGDSKETLRLFGDAHAVSLARAAMFNAQIAWSPIKLD
jgi:hypothetical protein